MQCTHCGNLNPPDRSHCYRCNHALGHVTDPPPAPRIAVGARIQGRFRVERMLGEGGMGQVYQAFDERLERTVALKVLGAELLGNRKARERFEREAKVIARVRHPNVIEVFDFFEHEGDLILGLEYVSGGTLAERIGRGMPIAEVVRVGTAVLDGLSAIHIKELVHRDIKPANILITETGQPKIADLGIAHDGAGRSMTRTGTRVGTPEYMAPEQVRGAKVDARTDIYAMGILLHEMITGEVPFSGDSEFDVHAMHVSAPPDPVRLREKAPEWLASLVLRALEKEPVSRWDSASAMGEALSNGLHTAPAEVVPRVAPAEPVRATPPDGPPMPRVAAAPLVPEPSRTPVAPAEECRSSSLSTKTMETLPASSRAAATPVAVGVRASEDTALTAVGLHRAGGTLLAGAIPDAPQRVPQKPRATTIYAGGAAAILSIAAGVWLATRPSAGESSAGTEPRAPATALSVPVLPVSLPSAPASAENRAASPSAAKSSDIQRPCPDGMLPIPAATVRKTHIPAFCMDRTEVTARAYDACLSTGKCPTASVGGSKCTSGDPNRREYPINCVQFEHAHAYCTFAEKRVPTALEWRYAATGTDGRPYPWKGDRGRSDTACPPKRLCSVGSYPSGRGPFGLEDMAGNVWELTSTDGSDCLPLSDDTSVFNGYCRKGKKELTSYLDGNYESPVLGFRCARDIAPSSP